MIGVPVGWQSGRSWKPAAGCRKNWKSRHFRTGRFRLGILLGATRHSGPWPGPRRAHSSVAVPPGGDPSWD